jgi:serine/threonine-protein kinase RsbW
VVARDPTTVALSWTAAPTAVREARAAMAAFAAEAGAGPAALATIKLAVSEAVTNAVLHAYVGTVPGPVRVVAARGAGRLRISVTDDGGGLKPRSDSPGSGLGLAIIEQMTRTFTVNVGDVGGTTLHMCFDL